MKLKLYFILLTSSFILCGCDLYPHIMGIPGDPVAEPMVQTSDANEYGRSNDGYGDTPGGAESYGRDTEFSNATDYDMPPQMTELVADNSMDDTLLVPERVAAAPRAVQVIEPVAGNIVVKRGDTVYSLARAAHVPLRDFVDANKLSPPYTITPGQVLTVPGARVHTVASGETLYSISRKYSVDVNSLVRENSLSSPYALAVGQKLQLPASVSQPTPAPIVKQPEIVNPKPVAVATPRGVAAPPANGGGNAEIKPIAQSAARASTKFAWPVTGKIISDFGAKRNGLYNDGINIAAAAGTAVRASENGVVAYAGNELKGMGNLIIVQHDGGWMTVYAHLNSMDVRRGAKVSVGTKIGTVGQTGKVTEPQLHFEIRNGTKAYNPNSQLKK
ncbi:MAG: M23 family metallopeptidase [Rickettsiales bacterium]|jgi:murein DD-endopeptidase MepM/ murein hydrolase activator NlpD|nr:M23 family metallopeptidase [Rickettsiales bacterium]